MTVWELPVLCAVSVLGGIKSICGIKLWNGKEVSISEVWSEKKLYLLSGAWLVLYSILWFGSGRSPTIIRLADLLFTYVILAVVDGKRRIVPELILLCYFAGQMLLGALTAPIEELLRTLLTGGIFAAAIRLFAGLSGQRMGIGDARLLGVTAMTAGWGSAFQILILAVVVSFVYSIWLLAIRKKSMRTEFPFVPFLAAGAAVLALLLI